MSKSDKIKLHIEAESEVNTYAHLRHANYIVMELIKNNQHGVYYHALTSLVLSAFTIEGFCNHLGAIIVPNWEDIESAPIRTKLRFLCLSLQIDINWGKAPWQYVDFAIRFRNQMAHGRSEIVKVKKTILVSDPDEDDFVHHALAKWQQQVSEANAVKCYESVREAIELMYAASKLEGFPFNLGISTKSTQVQRPNT